MKTRYMLTLDDCRKISSAAEAEARKNNWNVVIAIVDDGGHLLHLVRMDGATPANSRIAVAKGDRKAGIAHFETAVAAQDKIAYNEPADWYYPVRETLGAALLMDGQPTKAEKVFRADLLKTRRNARSLFGLHQALLAQSKTDQAELVRRQFEREWRNSELRLNIEQF